VNETDTRDYAALGKRICQLLGLEKEERELKLQLMSDGSVRVRKLEHSSGCRPCST